MIKDSTKSLWSRQRILMNCNPCMTRYLNKFVSTWFKMVFQLSNKFWLSKSSNTFLISRQNNNLRKFRRSLCSQVGPAKKVGHNKEVIAMISLNATRSGRCRKKDGFKRVRKWRDRMKSLAVRFSRKPMPGILFIWKRLLIGDSTIQLIIKRCSRCGTEI